MSVKISNLKLDYSGNMHKAMHLIVLIEFNLMHELSSNRTNVILLSFMTYTLNQNPSH